MAIRDSKVITDALIEDVYNEANIEHYWRGNKDITFADNQPRKMCGVLGASKIPPVGSFKYGLKGCHTTFCFTSLGAV